MLRSPIAVRGLALLLGLAIVPLACTKKTETTSQPNPTTGDPGTTTAPVAVATPPRPAVELVNFNARIDGLERMLTAGEAILAQVSPDRPVNLHAVVESIAAQRGVGTPFVHALDLNGRLGVAIGVPRRGQEHARPDDMRLSASLPATDAKAALEAMTDRFAPQPLGGGVWRSAQPDEVEFLVRPTSTSLELGRTPSDLDGASGLVAAASAHALDVHATDLAPGEVDPGPLLSFAGPFAGHVKQAMDRATEFRVTGDLAVQRELQLALDVRADLSGLGLDPLGPARTEPSTVTRSLPSGPLAIVSLSWGDPALIHRELDRLVARVPEPFTDWVTDLAQAAHATIDAVADEIVVAIYLDAHEHASLVIASGLTSDAAGRSAVRALLGATADLGVKYKDVSGDDREFRFDVEFNREAATLSGTKVDVFTASIPRAFTADAKRVGMVLGRTRPRVQAYAAVEGGVGMIALGAGARDSATDFLANRRSGATGAEAQRGLALAREAASGCGLCLAVDAREAFRAWAVHRRDFDAAPDAADQLAAAAALPAGALFSLGARADDAGGALAIGATPELLYAPGGAPSIVGTAIEWFEAVFLPPDED